MRLQKLSIVLLLLSSVATAACGCRLDRDEVLKIGQRIETELPLGSTKAQVTKFLDDMHNEHGGRIEIMDTTRYNNLEQILGNVYSFSGGEPAGTWSSFSATINCSNGGWTVGAGVDVIPGERTNLYTGRMIFINVTTPEAKRDRTSACSRLAGRWKLKARLDGVYAS